MPSFTSQRRAVVARHRRGRPLRSRHRPHPPPRPQGQRGQGIDQSMDSANNQI